MLIPLLCLERDPDLPVAPQEEASLILKLERKPHGLCHIPKDTDFPVHSRQVLMPGHLFECNPEDEVTTQGALTHWLHPQEKAASSKCNSTSGLTPHEQLERQEEFRASTQNED